MTTPDRTDLSGSKATGPLDRTETPYAHNDLTPSLKAEVERLTEEAAKQDSPSKEILRLSIFGIRLPDEPDQARAVLALQARAEAAEGQLATLTAEVERLTFLLGRHSEMSVSYAFKIDEITQENRTLTAERDALKERAEQRYERLERLNEDYVALRAQLAAKSSDNERLRKALETVLERLRAYRATVAFRHHLRPADFLSDINAIKAALNPNTKEKTDEAQR